MRYDTPQNGILPLPYNYNPICAVRELVVPEVNLAHLRQLVGERDNRVPHALIDTINFHLKDKMGKLIIVQVSPTSYDKKKKKFENEMKRLSSSIYYGNLKERKRKFVSR